MSKLSELEEKVLVMSQLIVKLHEEVKMLATAVSGIMEKKALIQVQPNMPLNLIGKDDGYKTGVA